MPSQPAGRRPDDMHDAVTAEVRRLARDLDVRVALDDHAYNVIVAGITKAMLTGARLGAAEMVAQVVEQGVDLRLSLSIEDPSIDELLTVD